MHMLSAGAGPALGPLALPLALLVSLATAEEPCFRVQGSGSAIADGVFVGRNLKSYAGPMAYNKLGTNLWMYRWHQTWWYLSELNFEYAMNEEDFTAPVIYSSMVTDPAAFPPTTGWTYDRMLHQELEPAPTVQHCSCEETPGGLKIWPCPRGELPCPMGADEAEIVESPRETRLPREDAEADAKSGQRRHAQSWCMALPFIMLVFLAITCFRVRIRTSSTMCTAKAPQQTAVVVALPDGSVAVGVSGKQTQLPYELVTVSATEGAPQARARE